MVADFQHFSSAGRAGKTGDRQENCGHGKLIFNGFTIYNKWQIAF
jgi:hypothetical protein